MTPNDKIASISEDLCIGCGICVKKCPFDAIQIINLPANLEKETTHRKGIPSHNITKLRNLLLSTKLYGYQLEKLYSYTS